MQFNSILNVSKTHITLGVNKSQATKFYGGT